MEGADGGDGPASWGLVADDAALCFEHIHDPHLAKQLWDDSFSGDCRFCPPDAARPAPVVELSRLAHAVWSAISEPGSRSATDSAVDWEYADSHKAPPDPAQVVAEECGTALAPEVLKVVTEYIDLRIWSGQPDVYVPRSSAMRDSWANFCRTVIERDLCLPDGAASPGSDRVRMNSLMRRIAGIIDEAGLITTCRPGQRIWRGRMRVDGAMSPGYEASDIGCAPRERAAENRMSRAGVPLFYGSADVETAVAEISARDDRPFAAVAAFEVTRPIRVFDLVDIPEPPSLFDREHTSRRDALLFLKHFAGDLSRPVFYDGRPHRDYRPTQYVTDYLRESPVLCVEGIRFRSAHNGGVNYALFVDAGECLGPGAAGSRGTLRLLKGSEDVVPRGRARQSAAIQAV